MASEYTVNAPIRAIGSKINIAEKGGKTADLYNEAVRDLLSLPEIKRLDTHFQHMNTSRLQHSINVSYYSFIMARFLRADARTAARAGLLHDMYYYNFKDRSISCTRHSRVHPQLALLNAMRITEVTDEEADIILTHMWPMTKDAPSRLEGYIVTLADKCCTVFEVLSRLCS